MKNLKNLYFWLPVLSCVAVFAFLTVFAYTGNKFWFIPMGISCLIVIFASTKN
jgi:hypothetical protein